MLWVYSSRRLGSSACAVLRIFVALRSRNAMLVFIGRIAEIRRPVVPEHPLQVSMK